MRGQLRAGSGRNSCAFTSLSVREPALVWLMEQSSSKTWVLATTGEPPSVAPHFHSLAAVWAGIEDRELELGMPPGAPVLVSGGQVDDRLNVYFRHGFARDQMSTARTYAVELRLWFAFLDIRGVRWDEARREDVRAFQVWRVYDSRNPGRVRAATWNKGWAALKHFYGWALREQWIELDPVGEQDRLQNAVTGGHKEKNARSSRDRWLTPAEYKMWRDVELRGYLATEVEQGKVVAGLPNEAFRGRNSSRNVAFTDYLISSGLREAEAGSLLKMEIPAAVGEKAPIIGKGRFFRHYHVLHRIGLESVQAYLDGERSDAVRRGQRSGRYSTERDRLVIVDVLPSGRRGQRIRLDGGRVVDVTGLTPQERLRLFTAGEDGLEPAALWLTEAGDPMPFASWNSVFNTANGRVSKARESLGVGSPWVHVTPHSLRFSFALMLLVAGVRATDERLGLGPADPFLAGNYSHVFDEVRDLLGHASVELTKKTYLEPVKSLRRSPLFRGTVEEVWDGIAASSPLIGFGQRK
jgi:integrase